MRNAKEEFLYMVNNNDVLCAVIYHENCWDRETNSEHILPIKYTEEQYNSFVDSLDFEYDSGYGGQELFGNVWFSDGTWAERGEYDGSEWWEHKVCPNIPDDLIK